MTITINFNIEEFIKSIKSKCDKCGDELKIKIFKFPEMDALNIIIYCPQSIYNNLHDNTYIKVGQKIINMDPDFKYFKKEIKKQLKLDNFIKKTGE